MGMCKGCSKVFNVTSMKDGLCEECYIKEKGVGFDSDETPENTTQNIPIEENKGNGEHTFGILSVVLGALSFFILTIILAPLGLYFGIQSQKNEKSPWAIAGIIISGIGTAFAIIGLLSGIAIGGYLLSQ